MFSYLLLFAVQAAYAAALGASGVNMEAEEVHSHGIACECAFSKVERHTVQPEPREFVDPTGFEAAHWQLRLYFIGNQQSTLLLGATQGEAILSIAVDLNMARRMSGEMRVLLERVVGQYNSPISSAEPWKKLAICTEWVRSAVADIISQLVCAPDYQKFSAVSAFKAKGVRHPLSDQNTQLIFQMCVQHMRSLIESKAVASIEKSELEYSLERLTL